MKLIYAMDEYGPHGPIPNSIGMNHYEHISHYYKTPIAKGMTYFYLPEIHISLGLDHLYAHHSDIVRNLDYYTEEGTIVYIINIHHNIKYNASLYYGSGRGAWIEYIPKNIIKLWEQGNCKIIISHNWANCEAQVIDGIFSLFYKEFKTCRDVYVWSTSIYSPEVLSIIDSKYLKNLIHLPYAEMWSLKNLPPYQQTKCEKDKKFIKLSRRYTLDRLISHVTFTKDDLNKYGFVSMPEKCTSSNLSLIDYIKQTYKNEEWVKVVDEIDLQYATLDQSALIDRERNSYSASWMGFGNKENLAEYYDRSYFSIVSESRFADSSDPSAGTFYTEKIMRAMLYEHPFLLQSVPYALEHLKLAGYKTFDKFWNEDYDMILNHTDRALKITEIVKDICQNKDLDSMSKEWADIVTHNKNHVYNRVADFKNYLEGLKNEKSISDGT
jgi:hypothetical protein